MKKPKLQTKEYLDYRQCADYVAYKLGVLDIRDYAGKFRSKNANKDAWKDIPYQDFWHFLIDKCDVTNGGFISITTEIGHGEEIEDWQALILKTFIEEFGEEVEYMTYW